MLKKNKFIETGTSTQWLRQTDLRRNLRGRESVGVPELF